VKRLVVGVVSVAVLAFGLVPAQAATEYVASQKTLASFSAGATGLTALQRSQVKRAVEVNTFAEKFICTGIRYFEQSMSVNIMVRKRAKAACAYAKELNPELSTWYQSKPTQARSYAGKVLLTVKSPKGQAGTTRTLTAGYRYPSCDSEAQQNLTKLNREKWLIYDVDCATDRASTTPALNQVIGSTPLAPCALTETSVDRTRYASGALTTGFPRSEAVTRWPDGEKNVLIVAFDWPDITDDISPNELLSGEASMFAEYMKTFTRGKVTLDVEIHPERITLLEPSASFSQSERQQNTSQWGAGNVNTVDYFYQEMIKASDAFVDYSDRDLVLFVPPRFEEVFAEFNLWPPGNGPYQTNEDPIVRAFTPGGGYHFRPGNSLWAFWVHESMHYFKLPDLYWNDQNSVKRTPFTFPGPMHGLDLMDGTYNRSLNSWLMWLAGWSLEGEQVCLTDTNFQDSSYELFPVSNNDQSLKAVMLKLSETELLIVESRRQTKFDHTPIRSQDGVLVYHVDTSIPHGEGAITAIAPAGRTLVSNRMGEGGFDTMLDTFLYEGNSLNMAGYNITVNKAYVGSDIVSISKDPDWTRGQEANYVCLTKKNRVMNDPNRENCAILAGAR
jgi:hypothetical protein